MYTLEAPVVVGVPTVMLNSPWGIFPAVAVTVSDVLFDGAVKMVSA
jgi:hypothetical protein